MVHRPNNFPSLVGLLLMGLAPLLLHQSRGFSPSLPPQQHTFARPSQLSSPLFASKKRRRKKPSSPPSSDSPSSSSSSSEELPDFDLDEVGGHDSAAASESPATKQKKPVPSGATSSDPLGEISANMMGSADAPKKSINQLLSDRSLESKLQFDETSPEGEPLPDLAALTKQQREEERRTGLPSPTSKKRARQEARRAAAAAAREQEEEEEGILARLPFIRDEEGKVSPLKILENSTWACIGMLVLWELYINSPFFDRAAPMAPVVYQFFL